MAIDPVRATPLCDSRGITHLRLALSHERNMHSRFGQDQSPFLRNLRPLYRCLHIIDA